MEGVHEIKSSISKESTLWGNFFFGLKHNILGLKKPSIKGNFVMVDKMT